MEKLGVGVMIQMLGGGGRGGDSVAAKVGDKIVALDIDSDRLQIKFRDGTLTLFDDGQSCCEARYMSTDDPLVDFVGAEFRGAEVRPGPGEGSDYDCHDTEFLIVHTSEGDFTVVNHNEHNGYYGGFWIRASFEESA